VYVYVWYVYVCVVCMCMYDVCVCVCGVHVCMYVYVCVVCMCMYDVFSEERSHDRMTGLCYFSPYRKQNKTKQQKTGKAT